VQTSSCLTLVCLDAPHSENQPEIVTMEWIAEVLVMKIIRLLTFLITIWIIKIILETFIIR
jgi:hypothetical protein